MNLNSKIAIVTGASSGIGAEFAKDLVAKGATVYALARRKENLDKLQKKLGDKFIPVPMDVTKHADLKNWVENTFNSNHTPDILINNAGIGFFADVDKLAIDEWQTMMDVNITAAFYLTRQIVPLMKQNENVCHIVNIASIAGIMGTPKFSGYNASKFAMRGFSEALFKELRYDGIKVTCFSPGSIYTQFFISDESVVPHTNMMLPKDISSTVMHILETPDNFLISDITMRPLNPKMPD
ncbi:MAG: SDR family oxidoreductase [Balneolaceae bacterium]